MINQILAYIGAGLTFGVSRICSPRVAKSWVNKVFDMSLVVWEEMFVKLPAVE